LQVHGAFGASTIKAAFYGMGSMFDAGDATALRTRRSRAYAKQAAVAAGGVPVVGLRMDVGWRQQGSFDNFFVLPFQECTASQRRASRRRHVLAQMPALSVAEARTRWLPRTVHTTRGSENGSSAEFAARVMRDAQTGKPL